MVKKLTNILNRVVTPKYPGITKIMVFEDTDYDYTTYLIGIHLEKYEDIYREYEMVKDVKDTLKIIGVKSRDIENIVFYN